MTDTAKLNKILESSLETLCSDSFKSFKNKLMGYKVPEGYNSIPQSKLQEADQQDVVKLIIRYYTTEHGPQIVMKVLEDIDERQASRELEKELKRTINDSDNQNKRFIDDEEEPVPRKKRITDEFLTSKPMYMQEKYDTRLQCKSCNRELCQPIQGIYNSGPITVNFNQQERQSHSYPTLVTPDTFFLDDININNGPLSDSNNTSALEKSSEHGNMECYKPTTSCQTPVTQKDASLKGLIQHNSQQQACIELAHYPKVGAITDKQGITSILMSDCSSKPFLQETHNGSDSIKQTAKEIDGQVKETGQLQQHNTHTNQQDNVAFSQRPQSVAATQTPVIARMSHVENTSVQVLQKTSNDIGPLDYSNSNVGEAAKQIYTTQFNECIDNQLEGSEIPLTTKIPSQDLTLTSSLNHCIPLTCFTNKSFTEQSGPYNDTLQNQDRDNKQACASALQNPTIAIFCSPDKLTVELQGTTTTCGPLLNCINELVKHIGSHSTNTIHLPGYNNQQQRDMRLGHSPTHPPAITTPLKTRPSTSEPVIECFHGKEINNGPLSVSTNKQIREEMRQNSISTQLQESTVHHNQQLGNIGLISNETPCSTITNMSSLDPSFAKYSKETITYNGPSSGPPNKVVAELGNPVKNISLAHGSTQSNKQSGNPKCPRCSPIEPVSETSRISIATDNIVPTLKNKSNHQKPLSDCTNQPFIKHIPPRGKTLPDMSLPELDEENLDLIEANHKGKPHIYAKLLFQFYVPYALYIDWVKKTNFDGFGGKDAIPNNLRKAILNHLQKRFHLRKADIRKIIQTINNLLSKLRTGGWPLLMLYHDSLEEPRNKKSGTRI